MRPSRDGEPASHMAGTRRLRSAVPEEETQLKKLLVFPLLLPLVALTGCATPGQTLLAGMLVYTMADCAVQKANRGCEERRKQQEPQPQYVAHRAGPSSPIKHKAEPAVAAGRSAGDHLLQEALPHVEDERVLHFWEEQFKRVRPSEMEKALSKVEKLLSHLAGRMFRQTANVVDFRRWIDSGYLVLVNLPIGRLGGATADAIASWILAQVFNSAVERVLGDIERAPMWMIYLDEAQRVSAKVTEEALTQLRKAKTPLVLAVQSRDQISARASTALRNIGTLICLNAGYEDAHRFAHEFGGEIEPAQFLRQPVGHGWGLIDGEIVQLRMLPPPGPRSRSYAKEIIEHSLANYYMTQEEFQEELEKRRERIGHAVKPKKHRGYDKI